MKIASVTFFPKKVNVSGAHVSAVGFAEWCRTLGIECDVIGVSHNQLLAAEFDERIDYLINDHSTKDLNNYDAIFFSSYPMLCEFNVSTIKIPFIIMECSEYEKETYGIEVMRPFIEHTNSIRMSFDEWYPSCLPSELWSKEIIPKEEYGMLYAARIFEMKNPILFMEAARKSLYLTQKAMMIGTCHKKQLQESLGEISNGIKFVPKRFEKEVFERKEYGLYWEVFGNIRKQVRFKRLNLSAIEALNCGMMPIVGNNSIPDEFKEMFISISISNPSTHWVNEQIIRYSENKKSQWERINSALEKSPYSYKAVEKQVIKLIEKLEKIHG